MRNLTVETKLFVATDAVLDDGNLDTGTLAIVVNGALLTLRIRFAMAQAGGWDGTIRMSFDGLESDSPFAYFLCRQFMDVLALWNVCGFEVFPSASHAPQSVAASVRESRPVVTLKDVTEALHASFYIGTFSQVLARSLGWYRRGLSSPDETLSFLALWNSLEIAASSFHEQTERTKLGIKNQIYQSFLDLWKGQRNYAFPEGESAYDAWIKENHEKRTNIAHGLIPLEPRYLKVLLDARSSVIRVTSFYLQSLLSAELAKAPKARGGNKQKTSKESIKPPQKHKE